MKKNLKILLIAAGVIVTPVLLSPFPRFRSPYSTVVEASNGSVMGARIAADGQWRFPPGDSIPVKFEKALLTFEDKWFYYHPGINPVSVSRALFSNIREHRIVSGGSTLTMQVARISGGNRPRTYFNKVIEILSALKLEIFRSKKHILHMYAANAPFGGNTVGLEAAAVRYTGKSAASMTWAEAAALAVLPNSPGLVYPGRNQEYLKTKRDALLKRMYERGIFDSLTLELAIDEPVPGEPKPIPVVAPHLTDYFHQNRKGRLTVTTIDAALQQRANEIVRSHQKELASNFIFNCAAILIEVKTGNVLAYVGNSSSEEPVKNGGDVDVVRSLRSTGSILKPFLYAAAQQSGDILPNSLIADIPTRFQGFSPQNFDKSFSGAVPAGEALSQSLNIPAVKLLRQYGTDKFLDFLKKAGFTTFDKPADHYGLSLILGGGETTLWELAGAYATLSRVLNRYLDEKKYFSEDYHPPVLIREEATGEKLTEDPSPPLSASAIWLTYEALRKVNRPQTQAGWQYFSSAPELAWKTGTSFGFRDGWAVGTTPDYVIGVWAGNADGEGRPGLTGITAAAPVLFDLVNILEKKRWFDLPYEDIERIIVCRQSGFRAGPDCPETEEIPAHVNGLRSEACPYHRIVHLDRTGTMQVTSQCESPEKIINTPWFILPPAMEYFYRFRHPEYKPVPAAAPGCSVAVTVPSMEFIYPVPGLKIFIPRDETGQRTKIVAEAAHRNPPKKIFWHLDDTFITSTRTVHQVEIFASPGKHVLTAVDEDGKMIRVGFEVVE